VACIRPFFVEKLQAGGDRRITAIQAHRIIRQGESTATA
jgi:hypothetical protein